MARAFLPWLPGTMRESGGFGWYDSGASRGVGEGIGPTGPGYQTPDGSRKIGTRTMVARVIFFFSVYASARPWAIAHARRAMCSAETATAKAQRCRGEDD
jgi:hypothetical protein